MRISVLTILSIISGMCVQQDIYAQSAIDSTVVSGPRLKYPEVNFRSPDLFPNINTGMYLNAQDSLSMPVGRMLPTNLRGYQRVEETDSTGNYLLVAPRYYDTDLGVPVRMSLKEYYELMREYNQRKLIVEQFTEEDQQSNLQGTSDRGLELVGADIAGQRIALRISGNVNINARASREDKNLITTNYLSEPRTNIIFNQKQNFSIEGNIGDRINVLVDYNSERDFQFENDVKINYVGDEDDIIQRIDAGNISLSLPGTQLVTFSPTSQGLFGIRTDMKIGPIDFTTVASIEQGKKQKMSFAGGASTQEYEVYDYQFVKNRYFYLDEYYRENFYPLERATNERLIRNPSQIIEDIEVFKSIVGSNSETGNIIKGKAWVDPSDTTRFADEAREADFKILEQDADYTVNRDAGYIRLNSSLEDNELLAVAYSTQGGETAGQLVFDPADSSRINLKMIRVDNPAPAKPTWDLMFKNVYSLGTVNLEKDGFEFEIVDTYNNQNDNINDEGVNWLQIFGLDKFNEDGQLQPDEKIDITNIVNLQRGEIFIPYLEPFRSSREAAYAGVDTAVGLYNPKLDTSLSQAEMYEGSYRVNNQMQKESRFKLVAKYSQQSANIKLNALNIIEGSEEVRFNGKLMQKGTDYNIDYFLGQVTILNEDALKPGADLQITFESNEMFQLDKKVIVGGRAEYQFGDNSFLAATGMYYSKSSIDDKVRIDQEPFRNFVWDVNGRIDRDVNFITRALDWLPLIRTKAPSRIQIEGEFAQVMPNPNTQDSDLESDGVAYIDDFEGSKKTTTMSVGRGAWTPASLPKGGNGENIGYTKRNQGFLYWFNPRAGIRTQDIWPNRETSFRNETNTTQILNVVLDPRRAIGDTDPRSLGAQADSIWGGFQRALPSSYRDQTESKFIEIWMRGSSGKVHLDLGLISEDVNGNRKLDTEDIENNGWSNDLIDEGEDIGWDRKTDEEEIGIYGWFDPDTLTIDSPTHLFEKYGLLDGDPAGDNYGYAISDRSSFRWINGMEGNAQLEMGKIPDTEDINRNKIQDLTEKFLRYTIPVDTTDNPYFVNGTYYDENQTVPTGWKLYRIPLTEFDEELSSPDASLEDVQFARIWFSDFEFNNGDEDTLSIAQMEIVGNEWLETGVRDIMNDTTLTDSSFTVTVVNNEDNQAIYSPPPGVRGEYDRVNQITSKEQSLVLKMTNFRDWTEGASARIFHQSQEMSLVNYKYMKMFIHGDDNLLSTGEHLEFFFRMGRDEENYYEYSSQIEPGWQEMILDMNLLAQIKAVDSLATESGSSYPLQDPRGRIYFDNNTITFQDTTSARRVEMTVHGSPSLTKIERMEAGMRNYTGEDYREWRRTNVVDHWPTYTGQVWLNELRVTGVDREGGMAMRGRASIDFADVMSVSVSGEQMDADFHRVDDQWGNNMNSQAFDLNVNMNVDKLLPSSWRLRIPIRGRYNERNQVPKYIPGSDVLTERLNESLPAQAAKDTIRTLEDFSSQRSYGTSLSRGGRSDSWLMRYTLDGVRLSYDYAESFLRNNTQRYSMTSRNTIRGSYSVQFPKKEGLGIFSFTKPLPLLGSILGDVKLSYLPTNINVAATINENAETRIYRSPNSDPNNRYNQVLQRNFSSGYNPFNAMGFTYNKRMDSNISDFRGSERWDVIQFMRPGYVTDVAENFGANYSPTFAKWLRPTFRYQTNYTYVNSINQEKKGVDVGYNQQSSVNLALDLRQMRDLLGGDGRQPGAGNTGRPGNRPQTRPGGRPTPDQDQNQEEEEKTSVGDIFGAVLGSIQPINLRYSNSRRGTHRNLVEAPDVQYRFGFQKDAEVPVVSEYAGLAGNSSFNESNDFGINTGVNITRNINASLNFSHSVSNSSTPNQTTKTVQRDYFLLQFDQQDFDLSEDGLTGFPFPGWSIRWSGLERLPVFEPIARSVTLTHNYSGRYSTNYRNGDQLRATYTQNLQPLVGMRLNLKGDISLDANYGAVRSLSAQLNSGLSGMDLSKSQNVTFSADYRRRGGLRLPLPFLNRLNMDNEITFNFTFNYNKSEQFKSNSGNEFEMLDENYSWEMQPNIDYKFTSRVTGGIYYKFGKRFSKRINAEGKPTTFSDFGLTVNIQIRG